MKRALGAIPKFKAKEGGLKMSYIWAITGDGIKRLSRYKRHGGNSLPVLPGDKVAETQVLFIFSESFVSKWIGDNRSNIRCFHALIDEIGLPEASQEVLGVVSNFNV